ncbi:DUF4426 domain-containing protein [Vibrio fortis]|jgi:hypothetical protein|uniref:DUF4426 domain-containing protein n=1 Tax=Vibrio fortis TaxID=212667 RepID=A0A066UZS1_9VIBR|nr:MULTISPECIES: DUF4426 domain-containing protein [Vibrio]KAB0290653.1 DUF4426 domain-containing protein [Vibrio fortis]KAB0302705.1 DUF4426 domain-containing protein [Vibrio fortis]KDN29763.1 hypothetical protein VFDL14_00920 [Vibrio fortis]MCG9631535.1 DUF4426 domain-containing protein [Vibrio sp. Isolate30]MDK9764408.1 DUF4426 domain-containing protein [Vibrio sp. D420a]|tara:strand:- start:389 stop:820 length:432 start_codon:yes stop_codon:yes gene_type:complete
MRLWITALLTSLIALPTWAGQFKNIKDVEVHYSAFNSTFLTAQVAKQYQLKRNGYSAILNISILDTSALGKPATTAKISGTARNLVGNTRTLEFREIKEGDAIYYLAEFPITHEENITFDIDVNSGLKGAGPLRFTQKFYVEE